MPGKRLRGSGKETKGTPSVEEVIEGTTAIALEIIFKAAERALNNKPFTEDEAKLVGRAIGWITLITADTENDVMKEVAEILRSIKETSSAVPPGTGSSSSTSGGRRKQRGGDKKWLTAIMAAIAAFFVANRGLEGVAHNNQAQAAYDEGIRAIAAACPQDLLVGPPPQGWTESNAAYVERIGPYTRQRAICDGVRAAVQGNVQGSVARYNGVIGALPGQIADAAGAIAAASGAKAGQIGGIMAGVRAGAGAAAGGMAPGAQGYVDMARGLDAGRGIMGRWAGGGSRKTRRRRSTRRATKKRSYY